MLAGQKYGLNVWLRQRPLVDMDEDEADVQGRVKACAKACAKAPAAKRGMHEASAAKHQKGKDPAALATAMAKAWRPASPPPRATVATAAAQLSTERKERLF